jgi:hypothetical protein
VVAPGILRESGRRFKEFKEWWSGGVVERWSGRAVERAPSEARSAEKILA